MYLAMRTRNACARRRYTPLVPRLHSQCAQCSVTNFSSVPIDRRANIMGNCNASIPYRWSAGP